MVKLRRPAEPAPLRRRSSRPAAPRWPVPLLAALIAAGPTTATASTATSLAATTTATGTTATVAAAATALPPRAAASLPVALLQQQGRHLVLDRTRRQVLVLEDGLLLRRFPAAVGMPGWETPTGTFRVEEKQVDPVWEHPENGRLTPPGGMNPLGSRWIGFHRDCSGRNGWDGERILDVKGCVVTGFHGTPHRWTVGRAVSHGCVRLYDEDVRDLFELVEVGTRVTVLP
jgi:lipoprotein-anchoring transpeptidase ErfK/SrfK